MRVASYASNFSLDSGVAKGHMVRLRLPGLRHRCFVAEPGCLTHSCLIRNKSSPKKNRGGSILGPCVVLYCANEGMNRPGYSSEGIGQADRLSIRRTQIPDESPLRLGSGIRDHWEEVRRRYRFGR